MKKIFISLVYILFLPLSSYAQEEKEFNATYESYQNNVKKYCDTKDRPWAKKNALIPIPQYPALDTDAINNQIEKTKNLNNVSNEEKRRLQEQLAQDRIAHFNGLKVVEVARNQYRAAMNNVFGCAVVDGRLQILDTLKKKIESQTQWRNSEINKKLDAEKDRLERQRDKLQCNTSRNKQIPMSRQLVNSASRQYCHYRYWLAYVDENFQENKHKLDTLESTVGNQNPDTSKVHPRTIEGWRKSFIQQSNSLEKEINRADQTLPRAIQAFQDMQYSYPIHLMLVIIYDDFIRLRNNLSVYMNASSQLYQKAYNAQDKNER